MIAASYSIGAVTGGCPVSCRTCAGSPAALDQRFLRERDQLVASGEGFLLASAVTRWRPFPVPSQRQVANPARPGREQRQQRTRVPGCGWIGLPPFISGQPACAVRAQALRRGRASVSGEVSERSKEHAWKVCMRQRIEGSNPSLSAKYSFNSIGCKETILKKMKWMDPLSQRALDWNAVGAPKQGWAEPASAWQFWNARRCTEPPSSNPSF